MSLPTPIDKEGTPKTTSLAAWENPMLYGSLILLLVLFLANAYTCMGGNS